MDANLATLLGLLVTNATAIIIALITMRKVDKGNAVGSATHTIANGRTEQLLKELAEKNDRIAELSRQLPPESP